MNTLSVCIIAKNEEKNLIRCLESIKGISDEIILVDTGSKDNTIPIAEKYNAKIIKFPWQNNFSSIRNKALDIASKDWILYIDSDESLDNSQIHQIKKSLNTLDFIGIKLKLVNIIDNKPYAGKHTLRIIKNKCGFYFSGNINEKLMNSNYKNFEDKIMTTNYIIYNYGFDYNKKTLTERCNRNLDIYLSFPEKDKNYLYYYNIGNEYYLLKKYNLSATNYLKALNLNDDITINSYLTFLIVKSYYHFKKYNKAILIGENFSIKYNLIREVYLILSECYDKLEESTLSKEAFKTYLSYPPSEYSYYFSLIHDKSSNLIPEFFGFSLLSLKEKIIKKC